MTSLRDRINSWGTAFFAILLMFFAIGVCVVLFMFLLNWSRHVACEYYAWHPLGTPEFWRCELPQ